MYGGLATFMRDLLVLRAGEVKFRNVNLAHMDQIAPTTRIAMDLIAESEYTGFGCVQFKYGPGEQSVDENDQYLKGGRADGVSVMDKTI